MSTHPPVTDAGSLIRLLLARGIDFILVGGAAAVAHGSATSTRDLDIVHSRVEANVLRLSDVLIELDAFFRADLTGRRLVPDLAHLRGRWELLLSTRLGPLDLLCQLHDGRGYEELLPCSITLDASGTPLRLLDLPTLIEVKTAAGRPKDLRVVSELLALLNRQTKPPKA